MNSSTNHPPLRIGWAAADITPEHPVNLHGQHFARVSEGTRDPLMATILALSSGDNTSNAVLLISCDLCIISISLRTRIRERITAACPGLDPESIILNATHTHAGPVAYIPSDITARDGALLPSEDIPLPVMNPATYIDWAAQRIADAAQDAWCSRSDGSIGYGLGAAVVGHNRRAVFNDGSSCMYGDTAADTFSHVEGWEDHDVNLMATWNSDGALSGVVINVACPSQADECIFEISSDFWHDVRIELRQRLGPDLFVLSQCSTAGDQSPRRLWGKDAADRMQRLSGQTLRKRIARQIADAVEDILPCAKSDRRSNPVLKHRVETVPLTRWKISEAEVEHAQAGAHPFRRDFDQLRKEMDADPNFREQPRWYVPITRAYAKWQFLARVKSRYDYLQKETHLPAELHVIRIGDVIIATNPFECYLDYGVQIKARSPAIQTFLVQLAGQGSYLPTARSVNGSGYGSAPSSSLVGPAGGEELVEWTVKAITTIIASDKE